MTDPKLAVQLDRMRGAAAKALAFVEGITEAEFMTDEKTQDAVMNLIVLGEATARIREGWPDFVTAHSGWPWHEIRGIRNRGAHAYETIDFRAIWIATKESLPALLKELHALGPLDPRNQSGS